ncbi:UNVERIFIED_ORG: hypothetical protein M2348_001095 [Sphingomonas sp. R1F5B]
MAAAPFILSAAPAPTVGARPGDPVPAITPSPAAWPIQAGIGSHHTRHRIATPASAREELRHFAALDDAVVATAARLAVLGLATTTITAIGAAAIIARALVAALPHVIP